MRVEVSEHIPDEIKKALNIETEELKEIFAREAIKFLKEKYEKEEKLGRGNIGEVWYASAKRFGCNVCVKNNYRPEVSMNSLEKEYYIQTDFYEAGGRTPLPFMYIEGDGDDNLEKLMVMETVDGSNFEEYIDRLKDKDEKIKKEDFDNIIEDLKKQIKIAHQAGVYHRDLDFKNVMIDSENKVYLIDFGESKKTRLSGDEDEIYTQEVIRNGQRITEKLPKDDDFIRKLKIKFNQEGLIERNLT
ncbi:MAG: protein kinase [Patescibacteria group bacterium]|nr:protein kinase [Patescibacteria group bacterium]